MKPGRRKIADAISLLPVSASRKSQLRREAREKDDLARGICPRCKQPLPLNPKEGPQ